MYFNILTSEDVKNAIRNARRTGARVRVWMGDTETGEAWPEEYDVLGSIGLSTGPMPVPLLVSRKSAMGGQPLLDNCIVRIDTTAGQTLYKHPTFDAGKWAVAPSDTPGYVEMATLNGVIHARFKKPGQAARYAAFMTGERYSK